VPLKTIYEEYREELINFKINFPLGNLELRFQKKKSILDRFNQSKHPIFCY